MRRILCILLACCSVVCSLAQSVITIQHGASTLITNRLDSAVSLAQQGDYIYLPGGVIGGTTLVQVDKKLNIIGAGYHPDSAVATTPTLITNNNTGYAQVVFLPGAEGSSLTGVEMQGILGVQCSQLTITRCYLKDIHFSGGNHSDLLIEENIIANSIQTIDQINAVYTNMIVRKNIIYNIISAVSGAVFSNNLILPASNGVWSLFYFFSGYFKNNILVGSANYQGGGVWQTDNNLFTADSVALPYHTSSGTNIYNEPISNIFKQYHINGIWTRDQDFSLKPVCSGIGRGSDGTDMGIFGTNAPFKIGGLPFNPHFKLIAIPSSTSADGKLNINITVQSQGN